MSNPNLPPIRRFDVTQYRVVAQTRVDPWMAERDAEYIAHCVHRELSCCIAETVFEKHKPLVTYPEPLGEVHTIDLYVFTPEQFRLAVRFEAKRWQQMAARYPGFTP